MSDEKLLVANVINELHKINKQINERFFDNKLKQINISISLNSKRNEFVLGSYTHKLDDSGMFKNETNIITIYANCLNGNEYRVIKTLLHEVIHQYNHERGENDTEVRNGRHKKIFADTATSIFNLDVQSDGNGGYFDTGYVNKELKAIINSFDYDPEPFRQLVTEEGLLIPDFKSKKEVDDYINAIKERKEADKKSKVKNITYVYSCFGQLNCSVFFELKIKQNFNPHKLSCSVCNLELNIEKKCKTK